MVAWLALIKPSGSQKKAKGPHVVKGLVGRRTWPLSERYRKQGIREIRIHYTYARDYQGTRLCFKKSPRVPLYSALFCYYSRLLTATQTCPEFHHGNVTRAHISSLATQAREHVQASLGWVPGHSSKILGEEVRCRISSRGPWKEVQWEGSQRGRTTCLPSRSFEIDSNTWEGEELARTVP